MSGKPQELTELEQKALKKLEEESPLSQSELVERLDVNSPDKVSDVMRSLRYKGEVSFSFEYGFRRENSE